MKNLNQFRKNGLDYTIVKSNDKVALYLLGDIIAPDGYEVVRIYKMRSHKAFGVEFDESEKISSNDQFRKDGSGAFRTLDNALLHFDKLTNRLVRPDNVLQQIDSDKELIPECQTVGENAS